MLRSSGRILTTYTGSLPRPTELRSDEPGKPDEQLLRDTVSDMVRRQVEAGIDVVSDGEMSKPGFVQYVRQRLNGFHEVASQSKFRLKEDFPGYLEWRKNVRGGWPRASLPQAACMEPLSWRDFSLVQTDIANLCAARDAFGAREAFLPSASVGIIAQRLPNHFYPTYEAYLEAIADTMRREYRAIVDSGLLLQIDAPEMCIDRNVPEFAEKPVGKFRARVESWVETLNYALQGIDSGRIRLHICWGNEEGPHTRDIALQDILDIILRANVGAYSIEAANPRHGHDWHAWEDTKLPEGKLLIPGVIDTTTNFVEHPQLVADRLLTYANLVGRANIIAGTDCGFGTHATYSAVYPPIVWAKLAALAEGASLASTEA
jgi:5-methyltetrahydropteroyltriglutamate--homocysteine methyltransferase